ncbi:MAG: PKD domain-containing protein [Prevotellaceae bacterium]|jgi:PKD repeat protein|nr:PKD domain-containing protein [Prevotellaceae bacterium]
MKKNLLILIMISLMAASCYNETTLLVKSEFSATVESDNYTAPVRVALENNSTGADFYKWTFDGGTPATSSEKQPPTVIYDKAGTYKITLEAWNNTERDTKEFTFSVDSAVNISFDVEVLMNNFAPAEVKITNATVGASSFQWTFDGGVPATSAEKNPSNVHYENQGEHTISLIVSNGRESFSTYKTINLDAPINVDFEVEPSFDDFDYEVPFTANLQNKTTSGLTYTWTCAGTTIANATAENTSVYIQNAGTYTIELTGSNGKETKTASKQIIVKPNTNLYTLNDVKIGIKSAEQTIGCFYSLPLRTVFKSNDVNESTGAKINIVFFGLDAAFNNCYFTSPDDAELSGFTAIPNATKTYFVNKIDDTALSFTNADFDAMNNDNLLNVLNIRGNSNTTSWFTNLNIPNLVLFETAAGIKGAIKVKGYVSDGNNSYILTDIKFQKQ